RIVGHLRACRRYSARQRRFAGVRRAEQAHVREQLQRELEPPSLAFDARIGLAGRAIHAGLEARIAAAALAALGDEQRIAVADEIAELLVGLDLMHFRALRHFD